MINDKITFDYVVSLPLHTSNTRVCSCIRASLLRACPNCPVDVCSSDIVLEKTPAPSAPADPPLRLPLQHILEIRRYTLSDISQLQFRTD